MTRTSTRPRPGTGKTKGETAKNSREKRTAEPLRAEIPDQPVPLRLGIVQRHAYKIEVGRTLLAKHGEAFRVYDYLIQHASKGTGEVSRSVKAISEGLPEDESDNGTGISKRNVHRCLNLLIKLGLITKIVRGHGRSNIYTLMRVEGVSPRQGVKTTPGGVKTTGRGCRDDREGVSQRAPVTRKSNQEPQPGTSTRDSFENPPARTREATADENDQRPLPQPNREADPTANGKGETANIPPEDSGGVTLTGGHLDTPSEDSDESQDESADPLSTSGEPSEAQGSDGPEDSRTAALAALLPALLEPFKREHDQYALDRLNEARKEEHVLATDAGFAEGIVFLAVRDGTCLGESAQMQLQDVICQHYGVKDWARFQKDAKAMDWLWLREAA